MKKLLSESLNLIDDIINDTKAKNIGFYQSVLEMMSSLYKNSSLGIFFCENSDLTAKSILNKNKCLENYAINSKIAYDFINSKDKIKEIKTKKDEFLYSNSLFVKLAIKESVFGTIILSTDNDITDELKTSFLALAQVISYKIKDYEFKEVKDWDITQRYSVSLSNRKVSLWGLMPVLTYSYTDKKSNIWQREYQKSLIELSIQKRF